MKYAAAATRLRKAARDSKASASTLSGPAVGLPAEAQLCAADKLAFRCSPGPIAEPELQNFTYFHVGIRICWAAKSYVLNHVRCATTRIALRMCVIARCSSDSVRRWAYAHAMSRAFAVRNQDSEAIAVIVPVIDMFNHAGNEVSDSANGLDLRENCSTDHQFFGPGRTAAHSVLQVRIVTLFWREHFV